MLPAPPAPAVPPPEPRAPEPEPAVPAGPEAPPPIPLAECVEVPGLGRTGDGFIQVSGALADDSGRFALQWICRGGDWRLRLQRCASGCLGDGAELPNWQDVAELALKPLTADEVLVFGAGACALPGPPAAATIVALGRRSTAEKLPKLHRVWSASLVEPFAFREIPPAGVSCANPDYGL
jgi:hypothetical protein